MMVSYPTAKVTKGENPLLLLKEGITITNI
jgi:hypothetical protein